MHKPTPKPKGKMLPEAGPNMTPNLRRALKAPIPPSVKMDKKSLIKVYK